VSIRSVADWNGLRKAGLVTHLTLEALQKAVRPGVTTAELDEVAREIFNRHGARSAPALVYGFPGTVLISINDEVVHGVPGPRRLAAGDVVKLDVTAEKDGYVADAARTVIVCSGTETAQHLIACARAAFDAALEVASAGSTCQRDRARGRRCGAPVWFRRRRRPRRSRRRPNDPRSAAGAEPVRSETARRPDGRSRPDHRAADQRWDGARRGRAGRLDDPDKGRLSRRASRAHARDHTGPTDRADGRSGCGLIAVDPLSSPKRRRSDS
jgi:Metallopeptidase family M24